MLRPKSTNSDAAYSDVQDDDSPPNNNNNLEQPSKEPVTEEQLIFQQAVRWTRLLVLAVFVLCAVIVGALTYMVVSDREKDDFQKQFTTAAQEILRVTSDKAVQASQMVASMSDIYTAFSHHDENDQNDPLPYVTLADYEAFGTGVRQVSAAALVMYTPYLSNTAFLEHWERHAAEHLHWIADGHAYHEQTDVAVADNYNNDTATTKTTTTTNDWNISPHVFVYDNSENHNPVRATQSPFCPLWQMSPPPPVTTNQSTLNLDLYHTLPGFAKAMDHVRDYQHVVLSKPIPAQVLSACLPPLRGGMLSPSSLLLQPVVSTLDTSRAHFVAAVTAVMPWTVYFENLLQDDMNGVMVVVESCGTNTTYIVDGPEVTFVGYDDLHDTYFDSMAISGPLQYSPKALEDDHEEFCEHYIHIFPTNELEDSYMSSEPFIFAALIVAMILFSAGIFLMYDLFVARRQHETQSKKDKTDALVNQLFPGAIRDRLFKATEAKETTTKERKNNKTAANDFVSAGVLQDKDDRPIADLFPEATVLFADIAGFTAWSSIREPQHVFKLLENIFAAFDKIAAKYGVFKVETIGDCYVASVGVPEPCADHAVVMAKFARDALDRFDHVVAGLELSLGPDTGDLAMRFGIHSGPVTAGVLRGDNARFQLFGDTVNIASKIESKGQRERIHLSQQTAELLIQAGYGHWITPREELVDAQDMGILRTYWLKTYEDHMSSQPSQNDSNEARSDLQSEPDHADDANDTDAVIDEYAMDGASEEYNGEKKKKKKKRRNSSSTTRKSIKKESSRERRITRLVDWNCELLAQLLKQVIARRQLVNEPYEDPDELLTMAQNFGTRDNQHTRDEVQEVITMPEFEAVPEDGKPPSGALSEEALRQLHLYVATIASMYRDNPFHNFEHASHVTMSVSKLLSRIVAPQAGKEADRHLESYGIASDPLTQFTVVLSALIHDVDHSGIPNSFIQRDNPTLASAYDGKSIAEQNSVDLAWNALLSDEFQDLRVAIFVNETELVRFRQLLVNSVIATDIFDKELGSLRKNRWKKAFQGELLNDSLASLAFDVDEDGFMTDEREIDRKATIVIEHLIQASDVAHTMQHWHVYCKWNERLFQELYEAYTSGRTPHDPSKTWYEGELGFFDNYIIPLAKKLKNCGVFGVASDEYLNYATENRKEWEVKGEEVICGYLEKAAEKMAENSIAS